MTVTTEEAQRVAYCQCGARLAGDSDQELFEEADRHIAEHHQPLGGGGAAAGSGPSGADEHVTAAVKWAGGGELSQGESCSARESLA
jgi:hypothetical protein